MRLSQRHTTTLISLSMGRTRATERPSVTRRPNAPGRSATQRRYDRVATATTEPKLKKATREALVDLLYRLGDDSLALGHRNSEWTGQGPILEEDIAFSSMAQDKLGHAQAFYTLLHELGEGDPESLAYRRGPEQYHCCKLAAMPRGTWAFSLVRHFLFAEADTIWYSASAV